MFFNRVSRLLKPCSFVHHGRLKLGGCRGSLVASIPAKICASLPSLQRAFRVGAREAYERCCDSLVIGLVGMFETETRLSLLVSMCI